MDSFIPWANLSAALIICIVTSWYSYETFKLRAIASQQLGKMIEQSVAIRLPYVLGGIVTRSQMGDVRFDGIIDEISSRGVRSITIGPPAASMVPLPPASRLQAFEVTSATDQVASHVWVLRFDHVSGTFAVATHQIEVIAPRESAFFSSSEQGLTYENVKQIIDNLYEDRAPDIRDKVIALCKSGKEHGISYLIPIFFDLGGRLYATPRAIYQKNGSIGYGKSDLLQPNSISSSFAPTFESTRKAMGTTA